VPIGFPFIVRAQLPVVPFVTQPSGVVDTEFITSLGLGTLRSNFTGPLGLQWIIAASSPAYVITSLARWVVAGNSATHTLSLYACPNTLLASVVVNTNGATAGAWLYGSITPVTLSTTFGTAYRLVSSETNAGDQWYDCNTTFTDTAIFSNRQPWDSACGGTVCAGGSHMYIPVNLKYHT